MHAVATPSPVNLLGLTGLERREFFRVLAEAFSVSAAISWNETELHASSPHDEVWTGQVALFTIHYSERVELEDDADRSTLLRHLEALRGVQQIVSFHRTTFAATIIESNPELVAPDQPGERGTMIAAVSLRYRVVPA